MALSSREAKPLNLDLYKLHTKVKIGEKLIVNNLTLLDKYINETFPEAFRTDLNPEAYFRLKSNYSTFEQKLLLLMGGTFSLSQGRVKRGISTSCPVSWMTDYQSTRSPSSIQMAVCNGPGTGCLSPGSRGPSCELLTISMAVLRFRGIDPAGNEVWQWEKQSVGIGCNCSGL